VSSGPALQRTPRVTDVTRNWSCRGRLFGYFRRQMTVVEIIIAELHCLSNSGHRVDCSAKVLCDGSGCTKWDRRDGFTKNKEMLMFRLRNKKCSEAGPNRRCSGREQYQKLFRFDLYQLLEACVMFAGLNQGSYYNFSSIKGWIHVMCNHRWNSCSHSVDKIDIFNAEITSTYWKTILCWIKWLLVCVSCSHKVIWILLLMIDRW